MTANNMWKKTLNRHCSIKKKKKSTGLKVHCMMFKGIYWHEIEQKKHMFLAR